MTRRTVEHQILVIGAGITGLTIENRIGAHASGRNSGVLHAGVYYTPGTLKARFCLEGNRLLKAFCRKHSLTLGECGKVIVTRSEEEIEGLLELKKRSEAAGAKVNLIGPNQLAEIEPYARTCEVALYSPNTAVFRPLEILKALEEELIGSGKVTIQLGTTLERKDDERTVRTGEGRIRFQQLINAAGTYADRIAHTFGLGMEYRILPFKGTYMKLRKSRSQLVLGNIYPVPDLRNPFLGVHFTRAADGRTYLGPTAVPALGRENYGLIKGLDREAVGIIFRDVLLLLSNPGFRSAAFNEPRKLFKRYIFKETKKLVPTLRLDDIERSDKVGIRAQLVHWPSRELAKDFVLVKDDTSLHILNAVSPGFTSSMAFARYAVEQLPNQ